VALAAALARSLQSQGLAAVFLDITWETDGLGSQTLRAPLKQPSASTAEIASLLTASLAGRLRAPLVELALRAEGLAGEPVRQLSLFAPRLRDKQLERVARDLAERMGRSVLARVEFLGPSLLEEGQFTLVEV